MVSVRVAGPDEAVPPGRIGYDLHGSVLVVHSFVAPGAYEELATVGVLRCTDRHVDPVEPYAYDWMRQQVIERLGARPETWPIWVWAKTTRRELVASARHYARDAPGTVLLTCRVPRSQVLLSHFGDWHCVLNAHPVLPRSLTDAEFDAAIDDWFARRDRLVPDLTAPRASWPKVLLDELDRTWQSIFDIDAYPRRSFWQGCVAELLTDDVVAAVRLVSPSRPGEGEVRDAAR